MSVDLGFWKSKLELAFSRLNVGHRFGCEIDQTDVCTCGAIDDLTAFKSAIGAFFKILDKR